MQRKFSVFPSLEHPPPQGPGGWGSSLLGGGTESAVSLYPMISSPDPGNPASQNKHGPAANRQRGNKTALRSGIWAKSALPLPPPPPPPPPSLPRAARLARLSSAQRSAARQPPSRGGKVSRSPAPSPSSAPRPGSARSRFRGDHFEQESRGEPAARHKVEGPRG